jgi:hypothetical protein
MRVVRFTDVTAERVEGLLARIEEGDPPTGGAGQGLQMLFDEGQGTAVVLQLFDSAEDMRTGGEAFAAMDPGETPGKRVSVDMCELSSSAACNKPAVPADPRDPARSTGGGTPLARILGCASETTWLVSWRPGALPHPVRGGRLSHPGGSG